MLKHLLKSVGSVCLLVAIVVVAGVYLIFNHDTLPDDEFYLEHTERFQLTSETVMPVIGLFGIAIIVIGVVLMSIRGSK